MYKSLTNLFKARSIYSLLLHFHFILGKKILKFAKIYASTEVLQRYAEILKIRLPIKQFSAHMLHSESAEGEDMLEFKLSQLDNNGEYRENEIRIPLVSDVQDGINSWLKRLQAPLHPDQTLFPRRKCQFTAVYSRLILIE